ncbi:HNH endonuclease [Peribacillus frigoritolerans]|uniref:HNH endonuclease n=1 Tax=Peribacillus frigoritolerans TaxID=450367 RepID=UPI0034484D66
MNESHSNNVKVFLFEVFKEKEYTFGGEIILIDQPYQEQQLDMNGSMRKVWIFPVKLKEHSWHVPYEVIEEVEEKKDKKAKKLSNEELEKKAKLSSNKPSRRNTLSASVFIRNSYVKEIAHRKANGQCQLCKQYAPFQDKHGKPFLEIHHIDWLSSGGQDSIENAVALCPNCHRKMHIVNDYSNVVELKQIASVRSYKQGLVVRVIYQSGRRLACVPLK